MSVKINVCRHCRREGAKLMLKGERCLSPKCAYTKRSYAPGSSSTTRSAKFSDYGIQLREKQKTKAIYNLREKQFKNYYLKASKTKEATGEKLLQMLEMRLDNVIYKLGFASSIRNARQMVKHNKIKLNAKKINIPSYQVKAKDKIELSDSESVKIHKSEVPVWLKLDKAKLTSEVIKTPARNEINTIIDESLIVEFYSR